MTKILTLEDGREVLRRVAAPVHKVTPEIKALVEEMFKAMVEGVGVGLAAPQVGESIRMLVFETADDRGALINPQILRAEGSEIGSEGCLSLPMLHGDVERATEITVRYLDENGKKRTKTWFDFEARVVQHEMDHLDGILLTDRAIKGTLHLVEPDEDDEDGSPEWVGKHEHEDAGVL
jgi:peptide deformylase